jgi:hypothetical protein
MLITLDDFVRKMATMTEETAAVNMHDVTFIQNFLIHKRQADASTLANTASWQNWFLCINDMFTRPNRHHFQAAAAHEPTIFRAYFKNLIDTVSEPIRDAQNSSTGLSANLAFISPVVTQRPAICRLYPASLKFTFKCSETSHNENRTHPWVGVHIQNVTTAHQLIIFDNDKLFPYAAHKNISNYDTVSLLDADKIVDLYMDDGLLTERPCGQVLGMKRLDTGKVVEDELRFNLTVAVKFPERFNQLWRLTRMWLDTANATNSNSTTNQTVFDDDDDEVVSKRLVDDENDELYHNLYDRVFANVDSAVDNEKRLLHGIIQNFSKSYTTQLLLVDMDLVTSDESHFLSAIGKLAAPVQAYLIKSAKRVGQLYRALKNIWLNELAYEIVYARVNESTSTIEWSNDLTDNELINCNFLGLSTVFGSSVNSTISVYANINCSLSLTSPLTTTGFTFISVRHKTIISSPTGVNYSNSTSRDDSSAAISVIETYASLHNFNLETPTLHPDSPWSYLARFYKPFQFKILYFFTATATLLLFVQIITYMACRRRLLMPRTLYHALINKWICVLWLAVFYTLGIQQVKLASICFITSIATHFLVLATFTWYALLFYSFFTKLNRLKKRNFNLIFDETDKPDKQPDLLPDEQLTQRFKRPVIYMYGVGYGVSAAVCAVVVAINRREYVRCPHTTCFTNNLNVLIGTLFVPVAVLLVAAIGLILACVMALRSIVDDLAHDKATSPHGDDEDGETAEEGHYEVKERPARKIFHSFFFVLPYKYCVV